jgi:hypothetical protein
MYAKTAHTIARSALLKGALGLAAALLALSGLLPQVADAHRRPRTPYHQLGAVVCGQGFVRAYPPRIMRSVQYLPSYRKVEIVRWSPDLWKFIAGRWRLVDGTRPWYRAFTSSIGYYQAPYSGAWLNPATNWGQVLFVPYYNLTPGWYAIKNYMRWDYGGLRHSEFSRYCRVA